MGKVLESIGIYGIPEESENLILQSLITGDPLLMIGKHGSAKTATAYAMARALGITFQSYDASKSMFEDMIGMPNPTAMQQGKMAYIEGPTTIWDKEFVFIDEVNRASIELQSKWLEVIRSRKVMGFPLSTIFVWGAMNPMGYEGAQIMDAAYCGRFATFVYIPTTCDMNETNRRKVINNIGVDDAPGINYWVNKKHEAVEEFNYATPGEKIVELLKVAQQQYHTLCTDKSNDTLDEFLAKFAKMLFETSQSSGDEVNASLELDGRRLGMMKRAIIAHQAINIAKTQVYDAKLTPYDKIAEETIKSCIPTGVNADGGVDLTAQSKIENTYAQLKEFFSDNYDKKIMELTYELIVTRDVTRKVEILLTEDINYITKCSAWTQIVSNHSLDLSLLAYVTMNLSVFRPDLVPSDIKDTLCDHIDDQLLANEMLLIKADTKKYEELNSFIGSYQSNLERVYAFSIVREVVSKHNSHMDLTNREHFADLSRIDIDKVKEKVNHQILSLRKLLGKAYDRNESTPVSQKRGQEKAQGTVSV